MTRTHDLVRAVSLLTLLAGVFFVGVLVGSGVPHDAISFWASGRLLLHQQNPYDAGLVAALQHANGYRSNYGPLIMRNPPSALVLVLPLGVLSLRAASLLWIAGLLAALIGSVRLLRTPAQLLGYTFGPALFCIFAGQSGLYALLGIALFLRFHRTQPFWAGAALWLCLLKPHLLLPFGVALLLWTAYTRSYRVLLGAASALSLSTAAAMLLKADIWRDYRQLMATPEFSREFIPCLAVVLRDRTHLPWMQYAPAVVAMVWAAWYFWTRRARWDWLCHGSVLLLVSLVVAPYAWVTDHAIVLPAMLFAAAETKGRLMPILLAIVSAGIVVVGTTSPLLQLHSSAGVALALLWPCLYALGQMGTAVEEEGSLQPISAVDLGG